MKTACNKSRNKKNRAAFTLVEFMVTLSIANIVLLAIGSMLVDCQKGWGQMYNRINSGVVTEAYAARQTFENVVRKSTVKKCHVSSMLKYTKVYYYQDPVNSTELDAYARFYVLFGKLRVDYGSWDESASTSLPLSTVILAENVTSADFSVSGRCIKMSLTLDNGSESMDVMCSAVRSNE